MSDLSKSAERQRIWWAELALLAEKRDHQAFFKRYAEYLAANGIWSGHRAILYEMAKLAGGDK